MADFLVIGIILLIVGIAVTYIWKAKKWSQMYRLSGCRKMFWERRTYRM